MIASLDLLAVLFGVKLPVPENLGKDLGASIVEIAVDTDNQSTEALQRKGTTTKFPLCSIEMELAAQLLDRGLSLDLRWRRRDRNSEADALTDEDFSGFDLSRRVEASGVLDGMICLPELSAACSRFKVKLVLLKAQGPPGTAGSGAR